MSLKNFRSWPVLVVCLVTLSSVALADDQLGSRLQTVLEDFHATNPSAPGVVVYVHSSSRDLDWTAAVGLAVRDSAEPLTVDCTFRIASNTKTYVAAAILRLAEMGKLSLDDPLGGYLPADQYQLLAGDGYDLEAMTIRQVLNHTSGLFEHPADPRFEEAILANPHHHWTRIEQITKCVEWGDPVGPPGNLFSYWWEIYEEQPAGAGPRAHQYYGDLDTFDWDPSLDLYGGGGLICDVKDLALFTLLLLEGRVLEPLVNINLGDYLAQGHAGFWNTFVFHVAELDLTVSGCILNRHAEKGRELAWLLVKAVDGDPERGGRYIGFILNMGVFHVRNFLFSRSTCRESPRLAPALIGRDG